MAEAKDPHSRLDVVDARLNLLADSVSEIATAVKQLAAKPDGISWREVLATLAAVAGFYLSITQISDRTIAGHTSLLGHRMTVLEEKVAPPRIVRVIPMMPQTGAHE